MSERKLNPKLDAAIKDVEIGPARKQSEMSLNSRQAQQLRREKLLAVVREMLIEMGRIYWGGEEARRAELFLSIPPGLGTGKPDIEIPYTADSLLYPEESEGEEWVTG